jgi:exopolysaccharide biosynthesis predicted pyruvyltransferase EpsI
MIIRRIRHALSARSGIAVSRQKLLREISGSPNVTFITGPGNIGDQLIFAGTRQLLAGTFYKEVSGRRRKRDDTWEFKRDGTWESIESISGHTALIAGSGGWCRPFHRTWPVVLPLIERRFDKVIVLPSSVDASVKKVREALAQTKALVFARERESYQQLRELCKTDIAHDCAFFFDFETYKRRGKEPLLAYRTDVESASGGEPPPGNNDISVSCGSLDEWLWTIARHELVETDRAHVMIAAAMLGKKVRYCAGTYHKVPAIAEYALEGFSVEHMPEKE